MDLTAVSYAVIGVVLYYLLLFVVSLRRRRPPAAVDGPAPLVVLVVPACDEELVITTTVRNLLGVRSPGEVRVLVMDDASTDATADLVSALAVDEPRLRLVSRTAPHARQGKSAVLNHAYELVNHMQTVGDPFLAGHGVDDIVLGVVDADGCLDVDTLERVLPYFGEAATGQVQIGVAIANAGGGVLERLQDIEFVGFSGLVQVARDYVGSPGLGGNGQFTRLSALRSLGSEPWATGSLTEDLELGLRLVIAGWRTRFCSGVFVHQQGLNKWRPLLKQRTRWIQGHYQCWRYIPRVLRAKGTPLLGRIDLSLYLLLVLTVVAVFVTGVFSLAVTVANVPVVDNSLSFIHDDFLLRALTLVLCVGPLVSTMMAYQRLSPKRLRTWELPAYCLLFTAYSYVVWVVATFRAWWRLARRQSSWTKTPRVPGAAMGAPALSEVG